MTLDLPVAQHAATVVLNLAIAVAVGAGLSRLWIASGASPWAGIHAGRLRRASLVALAIAMPASVCGLWLEAAAMAEVPVVQAGAASWSMLTATHFGAAWMIGIGALIFSTGVSAFATQAASVRRLVSLNLFGLAVFLFTRSMVSHASADGDFNAPMIADWLHLVLICVWVGEVFVAGFLTLAAPPGQRKNDRDDCGRYIETLSASATFALAVIVATGLFSAWHNIGSARALIGSVYGTTLLVKLSLVAIAAMLGGANRFIVMPALIAAIRGNDSATPSAMRRFTMTLRIEAAVLLGVLMLAALLSSTYPPSGMTSLSVETRCESVAEVAQRTQYPMQRAPFLHRGMV